MSQIGIGQSPAKIQLNFNKSIWQSGHWALNNSLKPISEQQCKGEITEWILSHPFLALARHTPDYAVSHLQVKHSRLIFLAELPHNQTVPDQIQGRQQQQPSHLSSSQLGWSSSQGNIGCHWHRDRPVLSHHLLPCPPCINSSNTAVTAQVRSAHSSNCLGLEGVWLEQVVAACEPLSLSTQITKLHPARVWK